MRWRLEVVRLRIGIAPVQWGIDPDYSWRPQLPAAEVLERTVRAGYAATEFAYNFPRDLDELTQLVRSRGLTLTAAFSPLDLFSEATLGQNLAEARWRLQMLARLGGSALLLADAGSPERVASAGRVQERPELQLDQSAWRRLTGSLETLGREARALELWVAYHHHAGTFIETAEEVDQLMGRTDPQVVGLCLDTGHAVHGGADPVELARRYGSRVRHVHAKDVNPKVLERVRREELSSLEAVREGIYCPLGRGCVDLQGVARELGRHGYEGWWIVEQDAAPDPDASAVASRRHLERVLGTGPAHPGAAAR